MGATHVAQEPTEPQLPLPIPLLPPLLTEGGNVNYQQTRNELIVRLAQIGKLHRGELADVCTRAALALAQAQDEITGMRAEMQAMRQQITEALNGR